MNSSVVPDWLEERFRSIHLVRYEASTYGPVNALLTWYFPVARSFMVKPQPKIRPDTFEDFLAENEPGRTSLDSTGAPVLPKGLGLETGIYIPDFMVVRATGSLHRDTPILLVEVKDASLDLEQAQEQVSSYLEALLTKTTIEGAAVIDNFQGLLVYGDQCFRAVCSQSTPITFHGPYPLIGRFIHNILTSLAAE